MGCDQQRLWPNGPAVQWNTLAVQQKAVTVQLQCPAKPAWVFPAAAKSSAKSLGLLSEIEVLCEVPGSSQRDRSPLRSPWVFPAGPKSSPKSGVFSLGPGLKSKSPPKSQGAEILIYFRLGTRFDNCLLVWC